MTETTDRDLMVRPDGALAEAAGALAPRAAVVLGSGLADVAGAVAVRSEFGYEELPDAPRPSSAVSGHAGRLLLGTLEGVPVAVFCGRFHGYQGLSARDAAYSARLAAGLGVDSLVLTNASGAVREDLTPGEVLLIEDHVNLTGASPLTGWPGPEGGHPFVPMHEAYDAGLRALALETAAEEDILLATGVYAGVPGPQFETPAEVVALRALGADVVGMSTVHETIAARALGLKVLGLSIVVNEAADVDVSHAEVLRAAAVAERDLERLLIAILRRL